MTLITMDGEYRTRSGKTVRLIDVNAPVEHYPITGYVEYGDGRWEICTWTGEGVHNKIVPHGTLDLIPVPKRHKRTVWLNFYPNDVTSHTCQADADHPLLLSRIACLKLDLEFTEGEGLKGDDHAQAED